MNELEDENGVPGYVTFEGNGRREAIARAMCQRPEGEEMLVECNLFQFADAVTGRTIARRVMRTRKWKKVED